MTRICGYPTHSDSSVEKGCAITGILGVAALLAGLGLLIASLIHRKRATDPQSVSRIDRNIYISLSLIGAGGLAYYINECYKDPRGMSNACLNGAINCCFKASSCCYSSH